MTDFNIVYYRGDLVVIADELIPETKSILQYAKGLGYTLPSNIIAFNFLIKGLKEIGLLANADRLYLSLVPDADMGFRQINLAKLGTGDREFYGGITINSYGAIEYDGTNGYSDMNIAFYTGIEPVKLSLNDQGAILVKTLSNNTDCFYVGRAGHGYIVRFPSGNSTTARMGSGTNIAHNFSGVGTIGMTRNNQTTVDCYTNSTKAVNTATNSGGTLDPFRAGYIGRGGFNANTYRNVDDLFIYYGKYYDEQMFQDFRALFNQYMIMLGLTPIA